MIYVCIKPRHEPIRPGTFWTGLFQSMNIKFSVPVVVSCSWAIMGGTHAAWLRIEQELLTEPASQWLASSSFEVKVSTSLYLYLYLHWDTVICTDPVRWHWTMWYSANSMYIVPLFATFVIPFFFSPHGREGSVGSQRLFFWQMVGQVIDVESQGDWLFFTSIGRSSHWASAYIRIGF